MSLQDYSKPTARVVLDSISQWDNRITTVEVRMHRFVLAEFNTHRMFSRNAASSRAIPVTKRLEMVLKDPAMPVEWGLNQKGMQAAQLADDALSSQAEAVWLNARDAMVEYASQLAALGIHKQLVNRLLEPWAWVVDVVTATDWDNFFWQRCKEFSPLAQPEMMAAADAIMAAVEGSTPTQPGWGGWEAGMHLPYVGEEDAYAMVDLEPLTKSILHHPSIDIYLDFLRAVSVARCARVSTLTHDGKRDVRQDIALALKMWDADPIHFSPFEHVATPVGIKGFHGNLWGWASWRSDLEERMGKGDLRNTCRAKRRVYGR